MNTNDDLPLHLAVKTRKPLELIQSTRNVYPEAIQQVDRDGNTFLHLVAMSLFPTVEQEHLRRIDENGNVAEYRIDGDSHQIILLEGEEVVSDDEFDEMESLWRDRTDFQLLDNPCLPRCTQHGQS